MIVLSITAVLLAGALLGLLLQSARPAAGGSPDGQGGRITPDGGGRVAPRPQRPFPYDHRCYPGSV